jgi:8-oxo-dGTP diphosphatase
MTPNTATDNTKTVDVAVGVIIQNTQTPKFFVCKRSANQHQGNKWEFPGGKVEANESADEALARELLEEIGIKVIQCSPLIVITFNYPDKRVKLTVRLVTEFSGVAHGAEGQESKWVDFKTLKSLEFPEANQAIIEKLEAIY